MVSPINVSTFILFCVIIVTSITLFIKINLTRFSRITNLKVRLPVMRSQRATNRCSALDSLLRESQREGKAYWLN